MDLGARIRKLRRTQRRTLQEIADRCDFTRSLLSKIETGRTVPPVATLSRIAAALGVSTAALLDDAGQTGTVHTPAAEIASRGLLQTDKGYSFFTFASGRADKLMQPFLFEVQKGQVSRHKLAHFGEEFLYVLEGEIRYRVGAAEYLLAAGDSLYFDAESEHEVTPISARARYLAVFVEPPAAAHGKEHSRARR
jgi:transcriptional regulator with XRE-family HTH domain